MVVKASPLGAMAAGEAYDGYRVFENDTSITLSHEPCHPCVFGAQNNGSSDRKQPTQTIPVEDRGSARCERPGSKFDGVEYGKTEAWGRI